MPPKKPFSETYRGKRKSRSEEMKKKKENKVFKKYLFLQGLCQDSTGYICRNREEAGAYKNTFAVMRITGLMLSIFVRRTYVP